MCPPCVVGPDAAVHDSLSEAVWTSDGGVRKLWFDRKGHRPVTLSAIVSALVTLPQTASCCEAA